MSAHPVQWVTASPLWSAAQHATGNDADRGALMRRPALLRFERDSFMADVAQLLEDAPQQLEAHVATPVSYRLPAPGESAPPPPPDLKLFQAAHGHFYLVGATLACRLAGLPEHEVDAGAGERVAFVIRRRDADGTEWGWVQAAGAAAERTWTTLDAPDAIAEREDLLPLFPLRYTSGERLRRLFVGLVPTSSAESFAATGPLSPLAGPDDGAGAPPKDPRPSALATRVIEPLRALDAAPLTAPAGVTDDERRAIEAAQLAAQVEASRFILLDFAEFLVTWMPDFWEALKAAERPDAAAQGALYDALDDPVAPPSTTPWRSALVTAWHERLILFGDEPGTTTLGLNLRTPQADRTVLEHLVVDALPPEPDSDAPATSIQGVPAPPPAVPKLDARGGSRYVIRCLYRRPQCGPLHPDVVSEPSEAFRLAGFFDLDAPARPIHISLPIDTDIKDLRKLRKNVNLLLSNQLREQVSRVTNLKDALDGKFGSGQSFDLGLICSFSIPIITICALIVLMIFISLLNIVFWWLPFLRICFPIGLKAKT